MCPHCNDTGKIEVSYASAENGPTADPADEIGIEYCTCDVGHALWLKETEELESSNAAYFAQFLEEVSAR